MVAASIGGLFGSVGLLAFVAGLPVPGLALVLMAAAIATSVVGLYIGRRSRWSKRRMEWVDVTITLVPLALYGAMATELPAAMNPVDTLLLIACMALVGRAVFVPSSAVRTLCIGAAGAVPVVSSAAVAIAKDADSIGCYVSSIAWYVAIIGLSTAVSRVTWNLRDRAERAELLGQYRLEELIAEGVTGRVYRARHALLRRPTAVKVLAEPSRKAQHRFEREVRIIARLTHPNTVTVFDYGRTDDGLFYYAMELVEGHGLDAVVDASGPMPPARVVHVMEQLAAALLEAHELGLIHRDIKPSNIMLARVGGMEDVVKVLDFGLVRDPEPDEEGVSRSGGMVAGTPLYISPEAVRNATSVDARADLYAVGAVGYFLLTGTHVFDGENAIEVCSHHLHTAPTPPSRRVSWPIPDSLERIVLACLNKDPDRRPRDARALLRALSQTDVGPRWTVGDASAWWSAHDSDLESHRESHVSLRGEAAGSASMAPDPSVRAKNALNQDASAKEAPNQGREGGLMSSSFAVPVVDTILQYASARSIPRPLTLGQAGLREHDLANPDGRVQSDQVYRMLTYVARELGEPGLPLRLAGMMDPEDLDFVGYALSTSASAQEAVVQAAKLSELLFDGGTFDVSESSRFLDVQWLAPYPGSLGERLHHELAVGAFLRHVRSAVGRDLAPVTIRFRHPAPADLREHRRFFRAPLDYSSDSTGFRVRRADLEGLVPEKADAKLNRFFVGYADDLLEARGVIASQGNLADRVREVVGPALPNQDASSRFVRPPTRNQRTLPAAPAGRGGRQLPGPGRRSEADEGRVAAQGERHPNRGNRIAPGV